jgi:flagellar assembly factor FliW
MKIQTKFFGEIEIDTNSIINFEHGIPGFEDLNNFVLLDIEDNDNLKLLQSIEEIQICLLMISPWEYFKDYEIQLSDEEINELQIKNEHDVVIYNIIKNNDGKITANLLAPVVINVINNRAKQIILSESKYNIRQEIPCL